MRRLRILEHSYEDSTQISRLMRVRANPDDEGRLRENRKKDSKAWSISQKEFQGNSKVLVVRLQSLRRDFETLMVKNGEWIADFLSRAMTIVSQMRSYDEMITDQIIVEKVAPKFGKNDHLMNRGCGRGGFRCRGRGFGRGRVRFERQRQSYEQTSNKNGVRCYHCKSYGHIKADGWYNDQRTNFAANNEVSTNAGSSTLFMAHVETNQKLSDVWFVDSGCSNHMTSTKSIFRELDEAEKMKVQLRNCKDLQVEGKGMMAIETIHSKLKLLHNVQFGPDLGYNLLSVAQLMASGYSIIFDDGACVIKDKQTGQEMV
ncbi:uncharacterized protein LOC111019837 [Momordica charantia]|uniref:Uncharacterized protein LOC111019837 n=1 Tax=Momordica charantia TaxID=3673 RepID=A0A6J1DF29_MOMCH|nr:uncharacterized protein LOC111019837 [Momordica charantia]